MVGKQEIVCEIRYVMYYAIEEHKLYLILACCGMFFRRGSVLRLKKGTPSVSFDSTRVTQLSWHPRFSIFLFVLDFCNAVLKSVLEVCFGDQLSWAVWDIQGIPLQEISNRRGV